MTLPKSFSKQAGFRQSTSELFATHNLPNHLGPSSVPHLLSSQDLEMQATCQCKSVSFTTPLPKPLAAYHCHCTECRKQSGSAYGTSAVFPSFTLPSDQPLRCWTRKTDSGVKFHCYFCDICGTRVAHARQDGDTVNIKGGCLEGLDWKSAKHIWCKRAVVNIPEGVERWEGEPDA